MNVKDWLIPGKRNHYHPHVLRPFGLFVIILTLLFVNLTYNYTAAKQFQVLGYATNISASEIISLSNNQRTSRGIAALSYNAKLTSAAQAKAQDMFQYDYWAHNNPNGTTPWYFIGNAGYAYTTAGENLAKGFSTSGGVVTGWMNSSGHRDNVLNSAFKETGIAVVNGVLGGEETTLVVALYAAPKTASAPKPAPAPSAPAPAAPSSTQTSTQPAPQPAASEPEEPAPAEEAPAEEPAPEPTPTATSAPQPPEPPSNSRTINQEAVSSKEPRTWAQNATFFILSTLLLINILKHTIVWRTQRRGLRHIWMRSHPAAQYGLIIIALLANAISGVGVVL